MTETNCNQRPEGIGIVGVEFYTPNFYVEQTELEQFDNVQSGKYTIGLGQEKLGFCLENEDAVSMALTCVDRLLKRLCIEKSSIGRIEVGSESHVDRAKSLKTFLMALFDDQNYMDISGGDHVSACYGGTAAFLSAIAWMDSRMWDGRYALVVATDIAFYDKGPARCTSGAGAVAMLIGPDAKVQFDFNFPLISHSSHVYDFYKGNMASEYPIFDGTLSRESYLSTLTRVLDRMPKCGFDHFIAHAPFSKMAVKACSVVCSRKTKNVDFKIDSSLHLTKQIGNMYCASVFAGLLSLLMYGPCVMEDKKVLIFSYGSGACGSLFMLRLIAGCEDIIDKTLIEEMLARRTKLSPSVFHAALDKRAAMFLKKSCVIDRPDPPQKDVYYLTRIDDMHRREYCKFHI